jgi:hypothetical protein
MGALSVIGIYRQLLRAQKMSILISGVERDDSQNRIHQKLTETTVQEKPASIPKGRTT